MSLNSTVASSVKRGFGAAGGSVLSDGLLIAVLSLFLLWPAVLNTAPLMFFDTFGYMRSGEAAVDVVLGPVGGEPAGAAAAGGRAPGVQLDTKGDGVQTSRSVYYGLPLAALYRISGTVWLAAAVQSLVLASAVVLGLRRFGVQSSAKIFAAGAALALASGLAVFTSALMPDAFTGVAILALAVIFAFSDRLRALELLYWFGLLLVSLLFHKAHLALALGLVTVLALPLYLLRRTPLKILAAVAGVCVLAGVGHMMVDVAVKRLTGTAAVSHPFVLARMIGDGTAVKYLDAHCGKEALQLCRYKARMPMTEEEFLFVRDKEKGAYGAADASERRIINAESGQIVSGTIREFAPQQVAASISNVFRQFFAVGAMEFGRVTGLKVEDVSTGFRAVAQDYTHSRIFQQTMPLGPLSALMLGVYVVSLLGVIAVGVAALIRKTRIDPAILVGLATILAGLAANAAISGAISGVFDRYQGRIAWLAAFALVVAFTAFRRARPSEPN